MPSTTIDSAIFRDLFSTDAMRRVFSDENRIRHYLEIEAALAGVEARLGIIPANAAAEIAVQARIENIDLDIVMLVDDMKEALYKAPGVGLAAPQLGCSKRLILVDPTAKKESNSLLVMVNPVIVEQEGSVEDSEMCLSVPEVSVDVKRAERILVKGVNLKGNEISIEAEGFLARIFQHEIDHLNGKVILDYASTLKRAIYLKKRKKGTL